MTSRQNSIGGLEGISEFKTKKLIGKKPNSHRSTKSDSKMLLILDPLKYGAKKNTHKRQGSHGAHKRNDSLYTPQFEISPHSNGLLA
jgi:hypothetical protein